jgi:APA family basic amino acid/polyamine antiporter
MRTEPPAPGTGPIPARRLTLFDSVMIVVTGTVGASIFIIPADVLRSVPDPRFALLLWIVAGGVTLMAGLACAELGAMFPEAGGQYVFIREAYGRFPAFLYGWILFTAGNSGALAAVAIAFALFLGQAFPTLAAEHVLFAQSIFGVHLKLEQGSLIAVAAIIVLTVVNLRSVKLAARVQNVTALAYLAAIAGIAVLSTLFGHGSWSHFVQPPHPGTSAISLKGAGVAMIALLFAYDGWEFLSWVAGEIENPRRNLPRALLLGIVLVIVTYLLVNAVFIYALPPDHLSRAVAPSGAVMAALFSQDAGRWVALFIAVICFGGASVAILGGARIFYSMAHDGVFFQGMKRIDPRWHTPSTSLLVQGAWVIVLILSSRYEQLYTCFVFMMTLTYVLTVGAVFVLRRTQPNRLRPYRCPGYPWMPIAYMIVASGFVLSTLLARPLESLVSLGVALLGVPLYVHWRRQERRREIGLTITSPATQPGTVLSSERD